MLSYVTDSGKMTFLGFFSYIKSIFLALPLSSLLFVSERPFFNGFLHIAEKCFGYLFLGLAHGPFKNCYLTTQRNTAVITLY